VRGARRNPRPYRDPSVDPNDNHQHYVDEAKKYFSGPITLANDLMKF